MSLGTLKFDTGINSAGFLAGIAQMRSLGAGASSSIGKQLASIKAPAIQAPAFGAGIGGIAKLAAGVGAITVAGQGLSSAFDLIGGSMEKAADFNETLSKTNAVLGGSAPAVTAFADEMADKFGIVKRTALDTASSFGGLAKGLGGLSGTALSDATNQMTKAALDLQSFANISLEEAGSALTIGLSGEQSDILKRLGVVTTEASLAQYALETGVKKTGGAFTEQQKYALRTGVILKGLGATGVNALGDLDRTIGGTANQTKKAAGAFENLQTDVGKSLLPIKDAFLVVKNSITTALASTFALNKPAFESFVGSMAYGITAIKSAAATLLPPFLSIGQTIAGAFASGAASLMGFLPSFGAMVGWVRSGLVTIGSAVTSTIGFVKSIPMMIDSAFGEGSAGKVAYFGAMIAGAALVVPPLIAGVGALAAGLGGAFAILSSGPVVFGAVAVAASSVLGIGISLSEVMSTAGIMFRNVGAFGQIAFLSVGATIQNFTAQLATIPENLGRIATWFANDWGHIMASPILAIGELLKALGTSIYQFMTNPTAGIQFDGSKILADFQAVTANFPEMMSANLVSAQPEIDKIMEGVMTKEMGVAAQLESTAFKMPTMPTLSSPTAMAAAAAAPVGETIAKTKIADPKFAMAATLGSKDAYASISGALAGRTGGSDVVARNGRDQINQQKITNKRLERVARAVEANKVDLAIAYV